MAYYDLRFSVGPAGLGRLWIGPTTVPRALPSEESEVRLPSILVNGSIYETARSDAFVLPVGYGCEGRPSVFSRLARRTLMDAGAAMESLAPKEETLFITLTHPGSTVDSMRALGEWSGYIVHRLKAWLQRRNPSPLNFWCWEWQKRGALHLHMALWVPAADALLEIRAGIKSEWIRLLDELSDRSGVDLWGKADGTSWRQYKSVVRVEAARVKHSVARYLSKYLSKGGSPVSPGAPRFFPSRWYGVSRALREAVRRLTLSVKIDCISSRRDAYLRYQEILEGVGSWAQRVFEHRCGLTSGLLGVLFFESGFSEPIQRWLKGSGYMKMSSGEDRRQRLLETVTKFLVEMRKDGDWRKEFASLASPYCRGVIVQASELRSVSVSDLEFVLDALALSLRRCRRMMGYGTALHGNLLMEAQNLIHGAKYWPLWSASQETVSDISPSDEQCVPDLSATTPLGLILNDRVVPEQVELFPWA